MPPLQTVFPVTDIYVPFLKAVLDQIANFWWLWLFLVLFILFEQLWLFNKQAIYKNYEWTLLEIKIPREIYKTPKAMEQIFLSLHGLRNSAGDLLEKYIDGEVTLWWSLEIVSYGGEIHFYVRTPKKHQGMTKASFYAQYQDCEIIEVPDYINEIPATTIDFYRAGHNIFGSEIILRKEDAYPIRTYEEFETPPEEKEALDPISALIEVLGGINKKEKVYIQIMIRPADSSWTKKTEPIIKKMKAGSKIEERIKNAKGETTVITRTLPPSPGEVETMKALERSITKPGFETLIRLLYVAPISIFSVNFARRGILGAFNQYASQQLNSFRTNRKMETRTRWIYFPHFFPDKRTELKRQRLLYSFRSRKMPEELFIGKLITSHPLNFNFASKTFILNTEELATIFHLPNKAILTGPHIKLAESKKMGPPAGLPIFTP